MTKVDKPMICKICKEIITKEEYEKLVRIIHWESVPNAKHLRCYLEVKLSHILF